MLPRAIASKLIGIGCVVALATGVVACTTESPSHAMPESMGNGIMGNGIVTAKSGYGMAETVTRLKQDIAAKGLMFFDEIDQAKLAQQAGIALRPSTLLVFGNPALGSQFMTANPQSGIDWPVRILVFEDEVGQVWTEYTDFRYVAQRHGIQDRNAQFEKASEVIGSITASVAVR